MVVALDDEVELDVLVLPHEVLELGRDECLTHAGRATAEVTEVEGELAQLINTPCAHLIISIITINYQISSSDERRA
jgi:hypothetical protein